MFFFSRKCAISPSILLCACTIFAVKPGFVQTDWARVSGCWLTLLQRRDGLLTTLFKRLYPPHRYTQMWLFAPALQFPHHVCHPPARSALLSSTLSLDALQHWPLPPLIDHVLSSCFWVNSLECSCNASECVDRVFRSDCPWFLCTWCFTLSKIWGFIFYVLLCPLLIWK